MMLKDLNLTVRWQGDKVLLAKRWHFRHGVVPEKYRLPCYWSTDVFDRPFVETTLTYALTEQP